MRAGLDRNLNLSIRSNESSLNQRYGKDLHVFIPKENQFIDSINRFFDLFGMRTRKSREYWLLDLTKINMSTDEISDKILNDLPNLDLDDDLYLMIQNRPEVIKVLEFYEIKPNIPRVLKPYASWDGKDGLQVISSARSKWYRRRDLKVSL